MSRFALTTSQLVPTLGENDPNEYATCFLCLIVANPFCVTIFKENHCLLFTSLLFSVHIQIYSDPVISKKLNKIPPPTLLAFLTTTHIRKLMLKAILHNENEFYYKQIYYEKNMLIPLHRSSRYGFRVSTSYNLMPFDEQGIKNLDSWNVQAGVSIPLIK